MASFLRKCKTAALLALAVMFALSGCAGAVPAPRQAFVAAALAPMPGSDDDEEMLAFLQSTLGDFSIISDCITDPSFVSMLSEDSTAKHSTGADSKADPLAEYLGILGDYDSKVNARLAAIKNRTTPNHPDIAYFQAAETAEFEMTSDVIGEYIQILRYNKSVEILNKDMQKIAGINPSDLKAMNQTVLSGVTADISDLKSQDVPPFLKSINDNMVSALNQISDALNYAQQAVTLGDPVRGSSAVYRWGVLIRRFKTVYNDVQQDSLDRKAKLKSDVESIRKTNNDLRNWVQGNVEKLSMR